jgi:hypothetical protein
VVKIRNPLARAAASVVVAAVLLAGTAGCTFVTPQATLIEYNPGNGVAGKVGSVDLRNVVAITADDGKTVSLLITLINSGSEDAPVRLQFEADGETRTDVTAVKAGEVASFGNEGDDQIVIPDPGVELGALMPVYVQYGDNQGLQLMVPVLAAEGIYEGLGADVDSK